MATDADRQLVVGTRNAKKRAELEMLLAPHRIMVLSLDQFPESVEVVEDGTSFAENASKKAVQQATLLGEWVMGEDSGVCVDALHGAPGIYSARFAGPAASDEANNAYLLKKLDGLPRSRRNAHYVCHMVLADPKGTVRAESHGECHGIIREKPSGYAGFGYDPLFELAEYHVTFGELGSTVKSVISHRARAFRRLLPQLIERLR